MSFETTRLISAPPDVVFQAFARGDTLARWWGPAGFTNEFETFEFREGGAWAFTMIDPNGARYPNACVFESIHPPTRLEIRHVVPPRFRLTITLEGVDGGTRLTWTQVFEDPAMAQSVRHIVEPANEQNLDRLTAVLGTTAPPPLR